MTYIAGVDESGKGDYFGPLVIASAAVSDRERPLLDELYVRDSKKMTDGRALEIAKQLKAKLPYSIVVIMPEKYNELYERIRNLNKLLAWGHARAIENLLEKVECGQVISDKFADVRVLEKALMRKGRSVHLIQQVRGESEMPVAAASVLARAEFLESVLRMGRKWKTTFPKGASALVDEAGRKFVETWGENDLDSVAKIHFKNTRKIRELLTRLL